MKIGDKVKAKENIHFADQPCHKKGEIIVIDKDNLSYFKAMESDYELIPEIDPYSKEAVIEIIMKRDEMSREDATETVELCIEELKEAFNEGKDHDSLQDILQDNLGLEPDYLLSLLDLE